MDDPISALDANVKKKIFKNVIMKELKGKTRILVTHAIDFLAFSDRILIFKKGEIVAAGSFSELKSNPFLLETISIQSKNHKSTLE